MPYLDRCPRCYGRGEFGRKPCDKCGGTGKVQPYRTKPSIPEAMSVHGWTGINSFPRYGREAHCEVCDKPLAGRKTRYCGSLCRNAFVRRMYVGVRWEKRHLIVRDGCACKGCGEVFESPIVEGGTVLPEPWKVEVDHIKRLIDGGSEHESNLQLLCPKCHKTKSAMERRRTTCAG